MNIWIFMNFEYFWFPVFLVFKDFLTYNEPIINFLLTQY